MVFFVVVVKVSFDSLVSQHSRRYLNENKSSKAEEQINCFYHTNLLSVRKRQTCQDQPLSDISGLYYLGQVI